MAFEAGTTLTVRGEGGDVFDMDVPPDGFRRETFDEMVTKGLLQVLGVAGEVDPDAPPPSIVPEVEKGPLDGLDKDGLIAFAVDRDIDVDHRLGVEKLRAAIEADLAADDDPELED